MRKHELADCENCPLKDEKYVPSYGPEKADLVIVGEAPGFKESVEGIPFAGPSGKLLDTVFNHYGINREKAFVTNVCLCRPANNDTPSKAAITACSKRLQTEITGRAPTQILALGNTAAAAIMGHAVKITTFRAGPPKESKHYPNVAVVPSFHPAACLRSSDSFPSLVADVGKLVNKTVTTSWEEPVYRVFDDAPTATLALKQLDAYDELVVDIETAFDKDASFEHPANYKLLCVGLGYAPGRVAVIGENALHYPSVRAELKHLLETKKWIAHNGKFDLQGLSSIGTGKLFFDTMLASYVLDERSGTHGLKYLAVERLGAGNYDDELKQFLGRGRNFSDVPRPTLYKYNAYDVACTFALYEIYTTELAESGLRPLHDWLIEASEALMAMELGGMGVDLALLDELEERFTRELREAEEALYPWVDNPRSPMQVKAALGEYGIEVASTDRETLETLIESLDPTSKCFEFVERMLSYRKEQKLYGTYVKGLRNRLYNGRVYPNFLLHGTTSGRLSCRNPNLQNIPRGSTIRSLFVPAEGNVFIQGDYSQAEYRVVATLAQEPYLKEIFDDESRDVFGELAQSIFGDGWTKHHRQIVKRVVHGSNYGMGAETMAKQINTDAKQFGVDVKVTADQAKSFQRMYFSTIPNVRKWQAELKNTIFKKGDDLVTPFGRHRRFWLITKENKHDIEKEGLAFVPQSTASDICLSALVDLHKHLPNECHIRLPVHDSILVECPADIADSVGKQVKEIMENAAIRFTEYVPFRVDIQTSDKSWGALS